MSFLVKVFKWLFQAVSIIAPFASAIWGVALYGGVAFALYGIYNHASLVIHSISSTFGSWAEGLDTLVVQMFQSVNGNSFFQFGVYCLSLDVPVEWVRDLSVGFVGYGLTWICGIGVAVLEVCVLVLGVYFIRRRIKALSLGLGMSGGSE